MNLKRKTKDEKQQVVLSRYDYQEILLAKMAGGDLYANETRLKLRQIDKLLDRFRDKPLYKTDDNIRPPLADDLDSSTENPSKNRK